MKPPILRRMAERDVERGFDHYLAEAGPGIAVQFVDAIDAALKQIELYPASGSPRYAERLGVAALRSCRVKRFPYVFIYTGFSWKPSIPDGFSRRPAREKPCFGHENSRDQDILKLKRI